MICIDSSSTDFVWYYIEQCAAVYPSTETSLYAGVPMIIYTDDRSILRTPLTKHTTLITLRYWILYQESKGFVYNSIKYGCLMNGKKTMEENKN